MAWPDIYFGSALPMLSAMSAADIPMAAMNRASKAPRQPSPPSSHSHNLANHGSLPDLDDLQELLVYLTMLFIVLSWMMREIHIAFFTTGGALAMHDHAPALAPWASPATCLYICMDKDCRQSCHAISADRTCFCCADFESNPAIRASRRQMRMTGRRAMQMDVD